MALNSLLCADLPLRNCSPTHLFHSFPQLILLSTRFVLFCLMLSVDVSHALRFCIFSVLRLVSAVAGPLCLPLTDIICSCHIWHLVRLCLCNNNFHSVHRSFCSLFAWFMTDTFGTRTAGLVFLERILLPVCCSSTSMYAVLRLESSSNISPPSSSASSFPSLSVIYKKGWYVEGMKHSSFWRFASFLC